MATKPLLSREYVYMPLADLNVDVDELNVHRVAFMDAGIQPDDPDWIDAIAVGSQNPLFRSSIGPALVLLVGPDRGDEVDTTNLDEGTHQVWVEVSTPGSDERVVRVAGTVTISPTGS